MSVRAPMPSARMSQSMPAGWQPVAGALPSVSGGLPRTLPMTAPVAIQPHFGGLIQAGEVQRPMHLAAHQCQTVVLVRDASGSMASRTAGGSLASEASAGCADLVQCLVGPENRDAFDVAVVDFDTAARPTQLSRATTLGPLAAIEPGGGGTDITAALEAAAQLVTQVPAWRAQGWRPARPAIVLFTDGGHNTGPAPHAIASTLRAYADLVTVAFGTSADEELLRSIATTPDHFYRCATGAELRRLLAGVGRTLSVGVRGAGAGGLSRIR